MGDTQTQMQDTNSQMGTTGLTPAPVPPPVEQPTWFESFASEVRSRITQLESYVSNIKPVETAAEDVIGTLAPNAKPVIAQVNELQSFASDLIDALHTHFGNQKMQLPAAPTGEHPPVTAG